MHTLEQSIAVLRKRNTDLANLVRQRHRPPESHGSHSRSASASAASVSAGLSSGHHHDETGPLAQNNLLTDPSLALSRSASSQENASSYVEDDGDMRVGDRAASSNHMQETAHSGMDSFSNNNNNNNSDPSDDIVDVEVETLLCPITQEAFEDPVVAADGHTYERGGILQVILCDFELPCLALPCLVIHSFTCSFASFPFLCRPGAGSDCVPLSFLSFKCMPLTTTT